MPEETFISRRWAKPAPKPESAEDTAAEAKATWNDTDDDTLVIELAPTRWSRQLAENQFANLTMDRIDADDARARLKRKHMAVASNAERDDILLRMLELDIIARLTEDAAHAFEEWLRIDRHQRRLARNERERTPNYDFAR